MLKQTSALHFTEKFEKVIEFRNFQRVQTLDEKNILIKSLTHWIFQSSLWHFQEALARNSARQIRLAFLLHAWNATLDYSENVLREAEQTDKLFNVSLGGYFWNPNPLTPEIVLLILPSGCNTFLCMLVTRIWCSINITTATW